MLTAKRLVRRETLDNGLRVIVAPMPHVHSAYVGFWLRAGARFEGACGLSHLLEHAVHATRRYPDAHALALAVDGIGGSLGASTSVAECAFSIMAPPESIGEASAIVAEIVRRPRLADVRIERRRVLEEILENEDGADEAACSLVYRGHPLARSVLGSERHVRSLRMSALRAWHRRAYVARNAVLVFAGPIEPRRALHLARRDFGALRPGRPLERAPVTYTQRKVRLDVACDDEGEQGSLRFAFRAAAWTPALDMLRRVLDGGQASRLAHRLSDASGLCYAPDADVHACEDTAYLQITAASRTPLPVAREVLAIMDDLARRGPSAAELEGARQDVRCESREMADALEETAEFYGSEALRGRELSLRKHFARISAAGAEDVRDAARELARPERLSVVASGPAREMDRVETLVRGWRGFTSSNA
jgi:predicted Zn-dependent peptidase